MVDTLMAAAQKLFDTSDSDADDCESLNYYFYRTDYPCLPIIAIHFTS